MEHRDGMAGSPFRPYRLTARFLTLPVLNDLSKLTPFARELTNVPAWQSPQLTPYPSSPPFHKHLFLEGQ
jgi:hypothetical protein